MGTLYPALLSLDGARALVVGNGDVAASKAKRLAEAGADVVAVAQFPGEALRALAAEKAIRLIVREWRYYDCDGAVVVVAATGDRELDLAIAEVARREGAWVNVPGEQEASTLLDADDPGASSHKASS